MAESSKCPYCHTGTILWIQEYGNSEAKFVLACTDCDAGGEVYKIYNQKESSEDKVDCDTDQIEANQTKGYINAVKGRNRMNDIDIFNKWYDENRVHLYEEKEILEAGTFFLIQQAFIAGLNYTSATQPDDLPDRKLDPACRECETYKRYCGRCEAKGP